MTEGEIFWDKAHRKMETLKFQYTIHDTVQIHCLTTQEFGRNREQNGYSSNGVEKIALVASYGTLKLKFPTKKNTSSVMSVITLRWEIRVCFPKTSASFNIRYISPYVKSKYFFQYRDPVSESLGRQGSLSVVSVVCSQVQVSASGWSLAQRSPT
jgi:hypothetical protein